MSHLIRAIALTVALALAAAACGGTAESTTPTLPTLSEQTASNETDITTTTEAVDPDEAFQDYTACMQERGIEMPDLQSGGGAISIGDGSAMDFAAFEEAAAECDPILEAAFGEFELSPEQEAEMMDQELAFAQCMRDNDVDWPDPSGDNGTMIELGDGFDPETVNAAIETCTADTFGAGGGILIGGDTP